MELWNDKLLARPPNNAVRTRMLREDFLRLRCILKHALNILESKKFLDREAAVLSRHLFRQKRRFRQHAASQFLDKVHRGLKRFFLMDVKEVFYNFEKSLIYALDDADVSNFKSIELYMPTRQLLDYVLIRTQGFAKLMQYLAIACENAASHFRALMSIGHLLRDYTLGFCIVSRIWYFSSYYVSCACSWYKELLTFREVMKPLGADWLPGDYKFPVKLSIWLGRNALTGKFWPSNIDVTVGSAKLPVENPSSVDLGEVISRDEYDDSFSRQKTDELTSSSLCHLGVTSCNELSVESVNKHFEANPQGSMKRKREKNDETDHKGKRKKKNKMEMENNEESDEEKDSRKLQEETGIRTKVASPSILNLAPFVTAVASESEKSISKKKELRGKEEIVERKKNKPTSIEVSTVIGHRFKKKRRKKKL